LRRAGRVAAAREEQRDDVQPATLHERVYECAPRALPEPAVALYARGA
jgi:hypothetical protein